MEKTFIQWTDSSAEEIAEGQTYQNMVDRLIVQCEVPSSLGKWMLP